MKKNIYVILIILFILGIGIFFYFYNTNSSNNKDYSVKTSDNENPNADTYIAERTSTDDNNNFNIQNEEEKKGEKELSSFTTTIHKDTKSRYSNIQLAAKTLNDTTIKSKDKFSLWNVLGNPTKEKGYQKAKTFTSDGKIIKSYGGGICQISTTLYNAVLKVEELDITERHEHSRDVNYIKDGKDASVSYNSADFRFTNNLDSDIKIKAEVNGNKLIIRILEL